MRKSSSFETHLNSGVRLLGVEADPDWEEVIRTTVTGELHASGFVASVYHRKLPKKSAAFLIRIIAVTFGHDWRTGSMTEKIVSEIKSGSLDLTINDVTAIGQGVKDLATTIVKPSSKKREDEGGCQRLFVSS